MSVDLGRDYGKLYLSGRSDRLVQLGHISLLDGKNNAYLGLYAGAQRPLAGGNNTFVGTYSGANAVSEAGVFLGLGSGRRATRVKETTLIGYKAGELCERVESSVCIGAYAGRKMMRANCNTLLGYQAGAELTSGSRNTIIGSFAAFQQFNGHDNVCVGHRSGYKNTIGANNTYIGTNSGFAAYAGYENVCVGVSSGEELYAGSKNVLLGFAAGSRIADASNCIAIGTRAMQFFSLGDTNTCLGTETARYFSGNNNTILGGYSVGNATGSFNSVLGSRSLNRRNGGRVQIDRCVVLGENVLFDVPVKQVSLTYADADVPSALTTDPNAANVKVNGNFIEGNARVLWATEASPIGDQLLPNERGISVRGLYWTSGSGSYDVSWGLQMANIADANYAYIPPAPYQVRINMGTLQLFVDSEEVGNAAYSINERLEVVVTQTSDPPAITVQYREGNVAGVAGEYQEFSADPAVVLPGSYVELGEPDALVDSSGIATIDTVVPHAVPPGGQVYILGSTNEEFNGKWNIIDCPSPSSFRIPVGLPLGSYLLGIDTLVYITRSREVTDVTFAVSGTQATMTGSHTLRIGNSFEVANSINADGVYTVTSTPTPLQAVFSVPLGASFGPSATIRVSLLEPDVSYAEITATGIGAKFVTDPVVTYNQRADAEFITNSVHGPSRTDGHTWVGPAGSQALMDANIRNHQLEFAAGGYSYARYPLGTNNTLLESRGTFRLFENLEFGVEWLSSYKLSCVFSGNTFDIRANYGLGLIANSIVLAAITEDDIAVPSGNIVGNTLPMDLANVLLTDEQWVTVSLTETFAADAAQLAFTITAAGGAAGWYEASLPPTISEYVTVHINDTLVPDPNGSTLRFYANAFTVLRDIYVFNQRYRDTPVFANVIYLGSDHIVSEEIDRQDVWITSLGEDRVLRANVNEFRVLSIVARANAVQCDGLLIKETTQQYSMVVDGSFTVNEIPAENSGNALHVRGNALFSGALVANGALLTDIPLSAVSGLEAALANLQAQIDALTP